MSLHGIALRFATAEQLTAATRALNAAGCRDLETYTPYPIEAVEKLLHRKSRLALVALMGGIVGGLSGFYLQYYYSVQLYPLNVGGRPLLSWPAFIPVTFEMTILFAGSGIFLFFFLFTGLPQPSHPIFSIPQAERITDDNFVLCLEATDPLFASREIRELIAKVAQEQQALEVSDVPL